MKKTITFILAVIMLLSLTACGKKDVSGLGKLEMGEPSQSGGIGTLGQPQSTPEPKEPVPTPAEEPAPTEEPVPTEEPAPAPTTSKLSTAAFSCDLFSCTAPEGWNVKWQPYDAGGGMTRLVVFITDPQDPNNMIFYVQALEPFFADTSAKKALCQYLDSVYEWSPVLTDGLNAESVLRQWASMYTLWEAQNLMDMIEFKNYSLKNVLQNFTSDNNTSQVINTGVLAEVTIPAASGSYAMFYENSLTRTSLSSITYYIGYNNLGFVIDPELYESNLDTFAMCKNSFDFTGFLNKYSVSSDSDTNGQFNDLQYIPFS